MNLAIMGMGIMVKATIANNVVKQKTRDSNLELFRIFAMLLIVAHHYVVHSGLMPLIEYDFPTAKALYFAFIGCAGKIGINCFVLITGYFMCKSQITLRKGVKLLLQIEFYKIVIFFIFIVSGHLSLTPKTLFLNLFPITSLKDNFVSCFLVFYCFIPFINIFIKSFNRRQHQFFLGLCFVTFCIFPQFLISVNFSYVSWFIVVYIIASYFRIYSPKWASRPSFLAILSIFFIVLSLISVAVGGSLSVYLGKGPALYFFLVDSNKPLALFTALVLFLFFKNIRIKFSWVINILGASSFGVLLIHDCCPAMRQWLWKDFLDCVGFYSGNLYMVHAIFCIGGVYMVCFFIDIIRVYLLEKPLFRFFDSSKFNFLKLDS